jgi:hypothetical protein
MNLTKCFVAGLCLSALTASAGFIKTNAFEGEPSTGWWVGDGDTLTTRSVPNDTVNGRASYGGVRPMADAANENVLKLDTEGGVWTNEVGVSFETVPVWADMLVKFVPSEELPTLTDGKLAVAIKLAVDGTNYLNVANNNGSTFAWAETAQAIFTSDWYRVTVKMSWDDELEATFAQVSVNGTAVGSPLVLDGNTTLNSIGFQGTGYIDEVVVRDDDPISTAVLLTLSFVSGTDIASVLVDGNPKNSGDTVASGSDLVITAAQWKEIASVTGPSTVTYVAGAAGSSAATVTVANATATTVTIAAQTETSTTPIGGGTAFSGEESNKVATWALANGVTTLSNDMYDQYLLNIAEDADVPDLLITSISVSGSTVTVTVAAAGVNFTTINGTLKIKAYPTLGGAETVYTANVTGYSPVTIVQDIGSNKFVKAAVE